MGSFLSFFYERFFGPSVTDLELSYRRQRNSKREDHLSNLEDRLPPLPVQEQTTVTIGDSKREDYQYDSDVKWPEKRVHRRYLRYRRYRILEKRTVTIGDSKQEEQIYECLSDFVDELQEITRRYLYLLRQELRTVTIGDSKQEERIYECLSDFVDELQEITRRHLTTLKLRTVTIRDSKQEERIYECLSDFDLELQKIIDEHLFREELKILTFRDSKREDYQYDYYLSYPEKRVRRRYLRRYRKLEERTVTSGDSKQEERIYEYLSDFVDELQEITRRHLRPELRTLTIGDSKQEERIYRIYECLTDFVNELQEIIRRHLLRQELRTVTIGDRELLSMPPKATKLSVDEQQKEKVAEAVISPSRLSEESCAAANTDSNTASLDSFINPTSIEFQLSCTEYVDPIESGESTSVQSHDFPMPSLTSHPSPVFSPNWHIVKEFTNQGGQLRREKSEVVLHVPNGAVKPCVSVLIKGAISIDFQKVHSILHLAADETVVSPVAEYDAIQNFFFQKPICVLLPHFLPPSFCQDSVSVLTFHKDDDGKISTHKMRLLTTSKEEEFYDKCDGQNGFYFTKSGAICVLTYHFSGFLCTYCRTNIEFSPVHLSLYAICRQQERKNVKVCLIMWDKRLHMQDFETQVLTNQEREMKSIQKDKLSMITENVEVREVGAFMDIPESHKKTWIHTAIDDFPIAQTKNLGDVLCSCVNSIPVKMWWSLHDVPCERPMTYFKCSIKVGYINMTATRKTTDLFNFCNSPTKQIFEVDDLKPQSAETESPAYVDTRMHNQINHQKGCLHVYLEKAKYVNCSISPINNGSENSNSTIEISR